MVNLEVTYVYQQAKFPDSSKTNLKTVLKLVPDVFPQPVAHDEPQMVLTLLGDLMKRVKLFFLKKDFMEVNNSKAQVSQYGGLI